MKKILFVSAFAILGIAALSSCRKDYECVDGSGNVISECNSCKSNGVVKASFDSSCALAGGTVQVK